MDFIKNVGFGAQIAVVSGYLAAVKGHNVVESVKALGGINKEHLKDINNYKHVAGRVFQTPLFLVGMVAGIVADIFSLVVNGAKHILPAIYNVGRALKAHITGEQEVASAAYYTLDFAGSHQNFVDPKNVDAFLTKDTQSILDGQLVQSEKPIADNVSFFNNEVAAAAGNAYANVATKLGFGAGEE